MACDLRCYCPNVTFDFCAKVACRDVIRQARVTRYPSKGIKKLAQVPLKKSEHGSHGVFRKCGQSLPVKISRVDLVSKPRFPYVQFSDWLKYLIEFDQLDHLVGTTDPVEMHKDLQTFWDRFRSSHPSHVMFDSTVQGAPQHPECTIPIVLHGDEGRGRKKKQVMILSAMGIMGKGSSRVNLLKDGPLDELENPLYLNMIGNTSLTHFLHSVLPISLYNETPEAFDQVLVQAAEYERLFHSGVMLDGKHFFIAVVGCKGDAPYLQKTGKFERSFTRRPAQARSRKPCSGICHQCCAAMENFHGTHIPFEDLGALKPQWLPTVGSLKPFADDPPYMKIPFLQAGSDVGFEAFYRFDIFHNFHLGVGQSFAASAICMTMELLEPMSLVDACAKLTDDFGEYCRRVHETPYHKQISLSILGVQGSFKDCPEGGWNKGDHTRLILQWYEDYCKRNVVGHTDGEIYLLCVTVLRLAFIFWVLHNVFRERPVCFSLFTCL